MVCLIAHTTLSIIILNCSGSRASRAVTQTNPFQHPTKSTIRLLKWAFTLTWETLQVDGPQKLEEPDTVLGEVGEILVDHLQRDLEDRAQDIADLIRQQRLFPRHDTIRASQSATERLQGKDRALGVGGGGET